MRGLDGGAVPDFLEGVLREHQLQVDGVQHDFDSLVGRDAEPEGVAFVDYGCSEFYFLLLLLNVDCVLEVPEGFLDLGK